MNAHDQNWHMCPPLAKTPREVRIEKLLAECMPVIVKAEMSPSTSPHYRNLIRMIEDELGQA